MDTKLQGWMVVTLLLGTIVYAIAEEITLVTYYPSPRGVYQELRTRGDVGIGLLEAPGARLHIVQTSGNRAFRVDDEQGDTTPFLIDQDGNVGIGISSSTAVLDVGGQVRIRKFSSEEKLFLTLVSWKNADGSPGSGTPPSLNALTLDADQATRLQKGEAVELTLQDSRQITVRTKHFNEVEQTPLGAGQTATTTLVTITKDGSGTVTGGTTRTVTLSNVQAAAPVATALAGRRYPSTRPMPASR